MNEDRRTFVVKAQVANACANVFLFREMKTMYGGKHIAYGDRVFVFASETSGGQGLIGRGSVVAAESVPLRGDVARQTPRVSITIARDALSPNKPLGRGNLKPFTDWKDGRPETELNFKFYRQSTDKIAAISDHVAMFLETYF